MTMNTKLLMLVLGVAVIWRAAVGQGPDRSAEQEETPEALKTEIEGLKAPNVAWRKIAWKSCLLDGLKQARAQNKPALLWVFIDRPVDDARC